MTYFQQLISCTDLHSILDRKDLVLLDASIPPVGKMQAPAHSWPTYAIPNARRFDLNQDFSDLDSKLPHTMPSSEHFERAARALGVSQQSQIVVYDDLGLFSAARAWYMFKAMGHKNVAVLDGGLPYWLSLNKPIVEKAVGDSVSETNNLTGDFVAQAQTGYFCDWREVEQQTKQQEELILDARANDRFKGIVAEPRAGVRSGHIPTSKNLPYAELFNHNSTHNLFKSPDELVEIFKDLNANNKPMIMSCGSGVTACILALAAELSGLSDVRVYDGSWSEWGSLAHTSIETD